MNNFKFVTFCSKSYIPQALALLESLNIHFSKPILLFMPLDDQSKEVFSELARVQENLQILDNSDLLKSLRQFAEEGRDNKEAIWAVKPLIIRSAILNCERGDLLFYCDADLFFFRSIGMAQMVGDVILSKQMFQESFKTHSKYGIYSAGFVGFKRTLHGVNALDWWIQRCQESTKSDLSKGIYADQKYLDQIPLLFSNVQILENISINQGLWALDKNTRIEKGPKIENEQIELFHFHGVRLSKLLIQTDIRRYSSDIDSNAVFRFIYKPYLEVLRRKIRKHRKYLPLGLKFRASKFRYREASRAF